MGHSWLMILGNMRQLWHMLMCHSRLMGLAKDVAG
jgi:hypothetical protein